MDKERENDIFLIQSRLLRLCQIKWNLDSNKIVEIFNKYNIFDYIRTCYEEYHVQGDDTSIEDIEKYLKVNGLEIGGEAVVDVNNHAMWELSTMVSKEIAEKEDIPAINAYVKFVQSKTGTMLFDESTDMWLNGPDYITNEYYLEINALENFKSMQEDVRNSEFAKIKIKNIDKFIKEIRENAKSNFYKLKLDYIKMVVKI